LAFGSAVNCLATGAVYALPLVKNYPPTPKELVANIQVESINKLVSVPILLEQLIYELESNRSVTYTLLSRLKFILYGGAPLSDQIAKKFIDHGVHLVSCYGSTETVNKKNYFHQLIIIILGYGNGKRFEYTDNTMEMDEDC
jgi:acyl-coenzyme A synthetase/AMP-(fatty) acid ligase